MCSHGKLLLTWMSPYIEHDNECLKELQVWLQHETENIDKTLPSFFSVTCTRTHPHRSIISCSLSAAPSLHHILSQGHLDILGSPFHRQLNLQSSCYNTTIPSKSFQLIWLTLLMSICILKLFITDLCHKMLICKVSVYAWYVGHLKTK